MDDRQRQVEVGSGLQESRLNEDFINLLQKYGGRVVYAVLAIVLAYVGWTYWKDYQEQQIDKAFAALDEARVSGSPDILLNVATQHKGKASVWAVANNEAASILVESASRGLVPGARPSMAVESDWLSTERVEAQYRQAEGIYRSVLADADVPASLKQEARWGLATALISLGDGEAGKAMLEEYASVANDLKLPDEVARAAKRLDELDMLAEGVPLYPESELPASALPQVIEPTGVPDPFTLSPRPDGPTVLPNSGDFALPGPTPEMLDEPGNQDVPPADPSGGAGGAGGDTPPGF